ncbi:MULTISPECIES: arsenate reductase ArsC [unclassified Polaromonas]|jgi:protein-tyrosine-phosphatase|uniref:arsenate reductase ArsC n=1 Tax=unclassified Polaromonas TaxID=2638319 RepID=UPI000BCEBA8B|nr:MULTISPECIES: arsenate reductase ArsC [unclassified Polaromonas]OYY37052.1 MAG: protein-tyrosine-phosphatase [Polaromonas sp. 35-63-35]OYZ20672.1 MAG: protein-tyrosine-phosphatase [Polaromonas sp. 16-63-31]OYZ78809.1 MAG: protein-tyrosine-phosphatase [Polaromonas sp. 24-63-21]OZA49677.1 MAG: protein-tyrosine-phosphatase [Polaromonas sp. 17-63-33]OZA89154.1 MAG: protein-tyrosine-phosphatase [Polaromonas sp. 39-63-25]
MSARPLNVLFLCTHNSARSVLAEATLNHIGKGRFQAFSAGSSPRENQQPNPLALQVLQNAGIATEGLRSKSWDEFGQPDSRARRAGPPQASAAPSGGSALHEVKSVGAVPLMDLVITVCDNAAGEVCPYWPGQPATAHWGYADPSDVEGDEAKKLEAFRQTLFAIRRRLELLINLPPEKLARAMVQQAARDLAKQA